MTAGLVVRADDVEIGDLLLGTEGGVDYVVRFVVGEIRDNNRGGVRRGPRFYPVNRREVGHLDLQSDTRVRIERPGVTFVVDERPEFSTCRHCGGDLKRCPVESCGIGWLHAFDAEHATEDSHYCYSNGRVEMAEPQ